MRKQKQKRYKSLGDIIISPEFKAFTEKLESVAPDSILDRLAKKKGIKLKKKIDLTRNIVKDATDFYNSPENEI